MPDTGAISGGTFVSSDVVSGNVNWLSPSNVAASDNLYADTSNGGATGDITWNAVKLIIGGAHSGVNRSDSSSLSASDTYKTFGGPSDKWGLSPTYAQVTSPNFGIAIQVQDGGITWSTTYFLEVTNFNFSAIPSGSSIDGIQVDVEHRQAGGIAYIDHVRITVTYSAAPLLPVLSVVGVVDNGTRAFGTVPINTATTYQFTITNTGDASDTLGTLSISGTGWSISGADNPSGQAIAASASKTVTVIGNFATTGSKSGALTIPSTDAASPYVVNLTAIAMSAAVTGTATAAITEADIVAGGKTIVITLTSDTWAAAGAAFDAQRQAIINGIDSAQAEATGWDAVVKATQGVAGVVRTSNTVVTITLDAQATYDITATETITVTVPSAALTGNGGAVVASPTLAVTHMVASGNRNLLLMGCG